VAGKALVIDADVARASGEAGGRSRRSREFLLAVRDHRHQLVMTQRLREEWRRHQSRFSRRWQTQMYGRKLVCFTDQDETVGLEERLLKLVDQSTERVAMRKDVHLVEAAWVTGRRIASFDEKARDLFHRAADRAAELRKISWVNPERQEEKPIRWLQEGAPDEAGRRLGRGLQRS